MRRAYPKYRDSGVEWLGAVPAHWDARRLKLLASTNDQTLLEDEDPLLPISYVDIGSVDATDGITGFEELVFEDAPSRARRLVSHGDTIISTVRTYLRAIAPIYHPPKNLIVSTGFAVIRPHTLDPGYCSWALREYGFIEEIVSCSTGVSYPAINPSQIGAFLIPLPPRDEQRDIAAFLDRETARIDKLVEKNRLLIERLAEYRTAMITRAVTRGLDPSAPLKPSGVEWLGDIPEHWEVSRLQYVATYRTSNVDKKTEDGELTVRLCNYTDVYYSERISANTGEYMEATASPQEIDRFSLSVGDIIITKDSEDWRDIAVPALIEETSVDFVCGYHLGIIRSSPLTEPTFLFRAMQAEAVNEQLQVSASGVTRFGIPNGAVGDVILPIPPVSEQWAIAKHLDREADRIDALTAKSEAAIERLHEYRAALITAAVTGKIDVREPEQVP